MSKVVYNNCYGGFSLSDTAIKRYAELKGLTLYPETMPYGMVTYWTAPPSERADILSGTAFAFASMEARQASNKRYGELTLNDRDFVRHDPTLVQVVEELGDLANGNCAALAIRELPSGSSYLIDEYDGCESVVTRDEYEWIVLP